MVPDGHGALDFRRVFVQSPALFLLLDPELTILEASDAYLAATMTTREFLVGRHLFDAFPDNPDDPLADGTRNLADSLNRVRRLKLPDTMPIQKYDVRRPASEGGEFEVRYWSPVNTPVLSPQGTLVAIIHRVDDITELTRQREAAAERAVRADELEQEASSLHERLFVHSQELQAANLRLVELDRLKTSFLSRMSHELRTPLNAVMGFAQLLELDEVDDERADSVRHILRAGRHLLDLIGDVLDISRIESGQMNVSMEAVPLTEIVEAAVSLVRPMATRLALDIEVEIPPEGRYVLADQQRALQVLINLLSNAVKYNRPQGRIRLRSESADGRVRVLVSDTGHGIAADARHRIFQPFDRLGQEQTDIEGTGVGLMLARELAERMGGSLDLLSSDAGGSTFVFELAASHRPEPVLPAGRAATTAVPASTEPMPGTVLYIDDNLANLRLLDAVVARVANMTLITALQGRLGVELAIEHRPDLVLLDVHLPDISGADVLVRLRADPATANARVVFLSADATPENIKRMTSLGADGYLTKPIDVSELISLVEASRPPTIS